MAGQHLKIIVVHFNLTDINWMLTSTATYANGSAVPLCYPAMMVMATPHIWPTWQLCYPTDWWQWQWQWQREDDYYSGYGWRWPTCQWAMRQLLCCSCQWCHGGNTPPHHHSLWHCMSPTPHSKAIPMNIADRGQSLWPVFEPPTNLTCPLLPPIHPPNGAGSESSGWSCE